MFRPERPSRRDSTGSDASPALDGPVLGTRPESAKGGEDGVLLQTWAPSATSGFGKRQRRTIVARLMPYQTRPFILWSWFGKRSSTVFLIRRPRRIESTMISRKNTSQMETV